MALIKMGEINTIVRKQDNYRCDAASTRNVQSRKWMNHTQVGGL